MEVYLLPFLFDCQFLSIPFWLCLPTARLSGVESVDYKSFCNKIQHIWRKRKPLIATTSFENLNCKPILKLTNCNPTAQIVSIAVSIFFEIKLLDGQILDGQLSASRTLASQEPAAAPPPAPADDGPGRFFALFSLSLGWIYLRVRPDFHLTI